MSTPQPKLALAWRNLLEPLGIGDDLGGPEGVVEPRPPAACVRLRPRVEDRARDRRRTPLNASRTGWSAGGGAREDGLGDRGHPYPELEGRLAVQRPVPFCSAVVDDELRRGACPVDASTWSRTSAVISTRRGVELSGVPLHVKTSATSPADRPAAVKQVVGLGDELHVGVLDAVVDHLDEVAGAAGAE